MESGSVSNSLGNCGREGEEIIGEDVGSRAGLSVAFFLAGDLRL